MIKHIVFFRVKSFSNKTEHINKLKYRLEALKKLIGQIQSLQVGINMSTRENAYDVALETVFADKEALEQYQVHPEHQKVVEYIKEITEDIAVVDYKM